MAVGFAPRIDIWEVIIDGIPFGRFIDDLSAIEYVKQVKESDFFKLYVHNIYIQPCSVVEFVGGIRNE
jgi:hypothetical protein